MADTIKRARGAGFPQQIAALRDALNHCRTYQDWLELREAAFELDELVWSVGRQVQGYEAARAAVQAAEIEAWREL